MWAGAILVTLGVGLFSTGDVAARGQ
jgi:hypothetical protein